MVRRWVRVTLLLLLLGGLQLAILPAHTAHQTQTHVWTGATTTLLGVPETSAPSPLAHPMEYSATLHRQVNGLTRLTAAHCPRPTPMHSFLRMGPARASPRA